MFTYHCKTKFTIEFRGRPSFNQKQRSIDVRISYITLKSHLDSVRTALFDSNEQTNTIRSSLKMKIYFIHNTALWNRSWIRTRWAKLCWLTNFSKQMAHVHLHTAKLCSRSSVEEESFQPKATIDQRTNAYPVRWSALRAIVKVWRQRSHRTLHQSHLLNEVSRFTWR